MRLYFDDPYLYEFQARVVERRALPDGAVAVVLDRTCFYPTSGGQPHDTGTLGGIEVYDVREDEGGNVVHLLRSEPLTDSLHGVVDGARRRHHMQQHSGQHLLSATFVALAGRATASFHLGTERCSIDLPGSLLEPQELDRIELRANEVVWEARPVRAHTHAAGDWAELRKPPPAVAEQVRVVEIEGWDRSPCCGTHVRRTSEVGLVKILGQERVRDSARVHFLCGQRALEECTRAVRRQEEMQRRLTCHPDEMAGKLEQLQQEPRALRRRLGALQRTLAGLRAAAWAEAAPRLRGFPLVVVSLDPDELEMLPAVAEALVERRAIALLGSAGARAELLFACPADSGLDLRPALRAACALVVGRGGGPPVRVQGAGERPEALEAALAAARATLFATLGVSDFDKGQDSP